MNRSMPKNIDQHIAQFPAGTQKKLEQVRAAIRKSAPGSEETINYGIPTFKLAGKNLVHFGGYEHHIGFYPTASGVANFIEELSEYKTSKGAIQLHLDKPIPVALIAKIVKFRVKEIQEKAMIRSKKKA